MPGDRFIELARDEDRHVLDILFRHASEAITVQDRSGGLLYANDTAAEMLGFESGAELASTPAGEILAQFDMIDRTGAPLPGDELPGRKVMAGEPFAETVVGYRRKGAQHARWSRVSASPIKNDLGEVVLVINFFSDITAQVRRDEDRELLSVVYEALGSSLDREESVQALAGALVPRIGSWCSVHILEPGDRLEPVAAVHPDTDDARKLVHVATEGTISIGEDRLQARVVRSGRPEVIDRVTAAMLDELEGRSGTELADTLRRLDLGSVACVPMQVGRRVIGALTVARSAADPALGPTDLDLLTTIADRAAATLENAGLYQQQRQIAETLQAVLTPRNLPAVPGLELAARYRPLSLIGHVGGDFYDVVPIPGGGHAVVVGDIAGKGIEAAAAVGLARYTLRSTIALDPGSETVLSQLNEALLIEDRMCTLAYVLLRDNGHGFDLRVTLAGHPPPIVITADGELRRLGQPCPPAGVLPILNPIEEEHTLGPGDILVLYTDGYAISELDPPDSVELALSKCVRDNPETLLDQMLSIMLDETPNARDDIALVALRVASAET
jgi:PAS domain S-box-containing protein